MIHHYVTHMDACIETPGESAAVTGGALWCGDAPLKAGGDCRSQTGFQLEGDLLAALVLEQASNSDGMFFNLVQRRTPVDVYLPANPRR